MSIDPSEYEREEAMLGFLEEELQRISEEPVFYYLAHNGDAIEQRVNKCANQARALMDAGFPGAGLVRAATSVEITIRYFLARPLLQGAFLSDEWAELLSRKILRGRTAEDRELLPAILRNWGFDINEVKLSDGSQAWERIVTIIWPRRNDYVHRGDDCTDGDAEVALQCLDALLTQVVDPLAERLQFTREKTACWSVVAANDPPGFEGLNPPREYSREDPLES